MDRFSVTPDLLSHVLTDFNIQDDQHATASNASKVDPGIVPVRNKHSPGGMPSLSRTPADLLSVLLAAFPKWVGLGIPP
jgi:hypothetical protein